VAPSLDLGLGWPAYLQVQRSLHAFNDWLDEHLRRLRADPGPDLLSQLVHVEDEGGRLDHVELRTTAGLLLAAGFETTVNLLGNGAQLLLAEPDQLAVLQAEPARWPDAVEEVLRYESPVRSPGAGACATPPSPACRSRPAPTSRRCWRRQPRPGGLRRPQRFDVTRETRASTWRSPADATSASARRSPGSRGEVGLQSLFERSLR
jgi:hypothetical protein